MIEVVNRQRRRALESKRWRTFAERALKAIGRDDQHATIAFLSDRQMRELNKRFRGLSVTTDILSFPAGGADSERRKEISLGDVAISVEQAQRQAADQGFEFDREIAQLILHGLLHLCGFDHERDNGEMDRLELRLRRRLGI